MKSILFSFFLLLTFSLLGQNEKKALYNPAADANAQLSQAMKQAGNEGKHVLLQVGGNWCKWCLRFNKQSTENVVLDSMIKEHYVIEHINYSRENTNDEFMARIGYPQRFGFPVFVVLDAEGNRLHTQNSWFLEDGKDGYDVKKTEMFLKTWSTTALDPAQYNKR